MGNFWSGNLGSMASSGSHVDVDEVDINEAVSCPVCKNEYPKRSNSQHLLRYTVHSICSSPYTARKVFPTLSRNTKYVCGECARILRMATVPIVKGKKRKWPGPRTPASTAKKVDTKETPPKKKTPINKIVDRSGRAVHDCRTTSCRYIKQGHYKKAFHVL